MLHAKFQDHRASGSGVEIFSRFLPYTLMQSYKRIFTLVQKVKTSYLFSLYL